MTSDYEISQVRALIQGGMPVYKACQQVGVRLETWYRKTNGIDRVMSRIKLRRMKRLKASLETRLEKVTEEIQQMTSNSATATRTE